MPSRSAQYVPVADGTRLAVTVHRPDVPATGPGAPVPAVLRATRYWRVPDEGEVEMVTGAGMALVLVDVRGSGASFGTWQPG